MKSSSTIIYSSLAVGCVSVLYMKGVISFVLYFGSYLFVACVGTCIGVYFVISKGRDFKPNVKAKEAGVFLKLLMDKNCGIKNSTQRQVVVSRNIDNILEEVIELTIRDYFTYFLKDLVYDHDKLAAILKYDLKFDLKRLIRRDDAWIVIKNVKEMIAKIDQVKFITSDVTNKLYQHFLKIRVSSMGDSKEQKPLFLLRSYLKTPETERDFLRKVSEALLVLFLPVSYKSCEPIQHLLREIVTCAVLYPTIELLCSPDYINQQLLSYLQYHQDVLDHHKKTYSYARTYEDFIKMINESVDVEHLKRMRYIIMSEIMQATRINNLKKAKGMDVGKANKECNPQSGHKGDLLQARNLKRYINQLKWAKNQCEKKIKYLGGPEYSSPTGSSSDSFDELSPHIPGNKVLPFQIIMESSLARRYFAKFLEKDHLQAVLGFLETVEEMKAADKKILHNIGNEAYSIFLTAINQSIKLEKNIIKGMESFLTGDKGPDAFFAAQEIITRNLEERHYPCFIVSDVYHMMLREADFLGIDFITSSIDQSVDLDEVLELSVDSVTNPNICVSDHSSFAKDKLEFLTNRLNTKIQALSAMKSSQNYDRKVIAKLEKEVETMKIERNQLEYHIERTEAWSESLGKWRILVQSYEMVTEKDKLIPTFLLVVHLKDELETSLRENLITEWLVSKKLVDFLELHRKLVQIAPKLKNSELAKEGKTLFKHYDRPYLEKTKNSIQSYMDMIMEDEKVCLSEVLYTFLSPTPELLKLPHPSLKKSKFFFSSFFKGNIAPNAQSENSDEDELLFLDDESGSLKDDPIAEPLYSLIGEVFDSRGVFKLLRRTLISFVQIIYGRTINRQLRDTVSWIFSESMIIYYLHLFRDSMWPNGILAKEAAPRTKDQKISSQYQARQLFIASVPEVLSSLVGQQNARKGALKVFESLQDERLNKQLLYEVLELFLFEITDPKMKSKGP
uniref:Sorting nexin-25 n=1 Tax=Strigamia maritima TaxID=126957 RepID=T1INF6_STRMM